MSMRNMKLPGIPIVIALAIGLTGIAASTALRAEEMVSELSLINQPALAALQQYEQLTGKIVIRDPQIQGNVTIVVSRPIPKTDLIALFESSLLMSGVAIVPVNDNIVKAIFSNARSPRKEGVPVVATEGDLPPGDAPVSFYMPFDFITARQAMEVFQGTIEITPPLGAMIAAPGGRAIIVTEKATVIRRMIEIRDLVDQPGEAIERKFVQLVRADADKVAEMVVEALKEGIGSEAGAPVDPNAGLPPELQPPQPATTPAPGVRRRRLIVPGGGAAPNAAVVPGEQAEGPPIQLIPDLRTNRIMVVSPGSMMPEIVDLIGEFDEAVEFAEPYERPLQYAKAAEVLGVLASVIAEGREEAEEGASAGGATGGTRQSQPVTPTTTADGDGSGITRSSLGAPTDDTAPEAVVIGGTRIIADKRANSIIIVGTREAIAKAEKILDKLDQKTLQVYLSTVIGELALNRNYEWSVDVIQKLSGSEEFSGASSLRTQTPIAAVVEPGSLNLTDAFPLLGGASLYGKWADTLVASINAFEGTGRFRILSRPSICVSNNKKAVFQTGQQIAVPTSTLTSLDTGTVDNAAVQASIDYKDVLLKIEIIPQINANREVTLQIVQTNDTLGEDQVISGNTVPTINTQQLETEITVPDRSTIIIGGLIQDTNRVSDNGVPFLSRIPILGYAFKGQSRNRVRRELVVMVQPVVVAGMNELVDNSVQQIGELKIGPTAVDFSKDPHGFESKSRQRVREVKVKSRTFDATRPQQSDLE
jgi:type II secretion system protein D